MTLAVATDDPNSVAETYVRQHIRLICPCDTVCVSFSNPAQYTEVPSFFARDRSPGIKGKVETLLTRYRTGYGAALSQREEARLENFLDAHNVTAVLAEFGTIGLSLRVLCKKMRLPLFVNFHGYDATVLASRNDVRLGYRTLAKDCAGVICGSHYFGKKLQKLGFPQEKITVNPCGVELDQFSATSEKDPNLLVAIGRLTRKKRPDLSIRAFGLVHANFPDLRFEMIGGGDQLQACEELIANLGLCSAVRLRGSQPHDEVKKMLARASVFVQHSVTAENGDQESQGISLLEAMASGVPVVTTDHNGFSETVVVGKTGFLSPEADVEAMAANIKRLFMDHSLAEQMGRAARAHVERRFDAKQLSARLRSLIFDDQVGATFKQNSQILS